MQRAPALVLIALATSVIATGGEIGDAASQTNEAEAFIVSERERAPDYATANAAEKAVSEAEEKAASEVANAAAAEDAEEMELPDAEEMELKAAAKRLRRLRKNQKMEEEATEWLARTLALVLQQAQSSEPSVALQLPIPRMQAKMATRSSDDDEDTSLPRMPWQTAAGPA